MSNAGFRIYAVADRAAFDQATEVLDEFAGVFGRKRQIKKILADDLITSAEIKETLLDRNHDGWLTAKDFRCLKDWLPFADRTLPGAALSRLTALFAENGENLFDAIVDYKNYLPSDIFYPQFYIAPPASFRADHNFMLGAVKLDARAYKHADKSLKEGYGFNPDFFNQSAREANPEVERYMNGTP